MLRISIALLLLLPTAGVSHSESPEVPTEKIRWSSDEDLRAMEGRWQMETNFSGVNEKYLPTDRHRNRIITSLFAHGAVLKIGDGKYVVEGSEDRGKLFNQYSKIEFRPADNRWLNTQEPLLSLSTSLGSKALFSYVVNDDAIHFRHPANSCSRSGIRLTLKRIDDSDPKED